MNRQQEHWAGQGGNDYHARQKPNRKGLRDYWQDVMPITLQNRVLEIGCGQGTNLDVLKERGWITAGIEINAAAAKRAASRGHDVWVADVTRWPKDTDLRAFVDNATPDMIITRGCLIHIAPHRLGPVFNLINDSTAKCVVLGEYHAPMPTEVRYRGERGLLWRGDFAAPLIDKGWHYVESHFHSRHAPERQDDITTIVLARD